MLVSPKDKVARSTGLFHGHRRKPLALSLWLALIGCALATFLGSLPVIATFSDPP